MGGKRSALCSKACLFIGPGGARMCASCHRVPQPALRKALREAKLDSPLLYLVDSFCLCTFSVGGAQAAIVRGMPPMVSLLEALEHGGEGTGGLVRPCGNFTGGWGCARAPPALSRTHSVLMRRGCSPGLRCLRGHELVRWRPARPFDAP